MSHIIASILQFSDQAVITSLAFLAFFVAGTILKNTLYLHFRTIPISGTVVGVIVENGLYTPVYSYSLPSGEVHKAKSITNSGFISSNKQTGRIVPLRIFKHNTTLALESSILMYDIFGAQFTISGIFCIYIIFTHYLVNWITWLFVSVLLVYIGSCINFLRRSPKQCDDTNSIEMELIKNAKPIEIFFPSTEKQSRSQAKTILIILPIALPFGLICTFFSWRYLVRT